MKRAVILGAGISGLVAANELAKVGIETIILEKSDTVGGLCASFEYKDFIFDYGPHKLYSQIPGLMNYIKNILGDKCVIVKKRNSIRLFRDYLRFPIVIKQIPYVFGLNNLIKIFFSYLKAKIKNVLNKKPIISYEDYFVNKFGSYIYSIMFKEFAYKVWGEPKRLSEELARRRVPISSIFSMIKRKEKNKISADYFFYPQKGIGEFCNIIAQEFIKNGGRILFNTKPSKIIIEDGKVRFLEYVKNKEKRKIKIDYVISTIPINELIYLFDTIPENVRKAAKDLNYRSLMLFYIILNKDRVLKDNWIFFPEKKYIINRISEQKSFSILTAPTNKTSIIAEVTYNSNDKKFHKEKIIKNVINDLEKAGIIKREWIDEFFVKKIENIYPIYNIGFRINLNIIFDFIQDIENLYTIGRYGLFNYNNMDHCIDMSMRTAQHIISGGSREKWRELVKSFNNYRIID
ncbi:MAG: FAD-dependent oxidoreductase [Candidatus Aenigmatarchaeota archaeon]